LSSLAHKTIHSKILTVQITLFIKDKHSSNS
jgi:hypothetical protein